MWWLRLYLVVFLRCTFCQTLAEVTSTCVALSGFMYERSCYVIQFDNGINHHIWLARSACDNVAGDFHLFWPIHASTVNAVLAHFNVDPTLHGLGIVGMMRLGHADLAKGQAWALMGVDNTYIVPLPDLSVGAPNRWPHMKVGEPSLPAAEQHILQIGDGYTLLDVPKTEDMPLNTYTVCQYDSSLLNVPQAFSMHMRCSKIDISVHGTSTNPSFKSLNTCAQACATSTAHLCTIFSFDEATKECLYGNAFYGDLTAACIQGVATAQMFVRS